MAEPAMTSTLLQQLASQYQTPQTLPAIQHSQYLAQALSSLQDSAKNNIKTPTALWSNLLAEGLLQYARRKSDTQLMGGIQSGQQAQQATADGLMGIPPTTPPQAPFQPQAASGLGGMLAHILGHGSPPPAPQAPQGPDIAAQIANAPPVQVGAPQMQMPPMAPLAGSPPQGPAPAPPPPMTGAPGVPTPAQLAGAMPGVNVTSGFRTPQHNAEVGGVANSWHLMGTPDAPGALDLTPPHGVPMQRFAQNLQAEYPQARVLNEGNHVHVQPNMPNSGAMPQPSPAPGLLGGGGAPPVAAPPLAAGGVPPSAATQPPPPQGVPTGLGATPQEIALYQRYMANPMTRSLGLELAQHVAARQAAPMEAPKNMMWDPQARQYVPMPGTQTVQMGSDAPGERTQADAFGNRTYGAIPNAVQSNQVWDAARGRYVPLEGLQPSVQGSFAPGSVVSQEPGKAPSVVQAPQYSVKDAGEALQQLTASPQYEKAAKLTNMYRGMVTASARPGGMTDAELKDNAAQIFSGGVARQFNAKMIDEGQGPLLRLKQFGGEIMSGQKLSPEARQAIIKAANDYTTEAQTEFRGLAKSKADFASAHGQDISPFLGPLLQSVPNVPDISTIPTGSGGYDTGTGHAAGPVPPGWPVIGGKPLDPNSEAGRQATIFLKRGLHYDPSVPGDWR